MQTPNRPFPPRVRRMR